MATSTNALRAELAFRLRTSVPTEWNEFSNHWMAFNAIYGGEPDTRERARVIASIRRNMNERAALKVLRKVTKAVDAILAIPPGNTQLDRSHPSFRAASQRYSAMYRSKSETAVGRLAAIAAVLYQVRCNLLHGSKDPQVERDRMLVQKCLNVLRILVPELEASCAARAV